MFRRPARLARHRHDRCGGIPFRGGTDRGNLVARLLPDRCGLAFGRFMYSVDPRPRRLCYGGLLAVSQVKDPPRPPERVGVPESPGPGWVSGLWWITVIITLRNHCPGSCSPCTHLRWGAPPDSDPLGSRPWDIPPVS